MPTLASLESILNLYREGDYDQARQALGQLDETGRPGESLLWRSRLATDPDQVLALMQSRFDDPRLPRPVQQRLRLDAADMAFVRGEFAEVLQLLEPLLQDDENVPGAIHVRAGLALRALGNLQRAREMLATVRPDDPAFGVARSGLGAIGLEQDDPVLALRYFESAAPRSDEASGIRTAGGRWLALYASGREDEAADLLAEIEREHPQSLAMLEINGYLQDEQDDRDARNATALPDTTAEVPNEPATGRYSIQLGAFRDRALALEFQRRYEDMVTHLRIDQVIDQRGQFLYKVRVGAYVNPALARNEAEVLERRLDLDAFVVDLVD